MSRIQAILIFVIGLFIMPPILGDEASSPIDAKSCNKAMQYFSFQNNFSAEVGDVTIARTFKVGLISKSPALVFVSPNQATVTFSFRFTSNNNVLSLVANPKGSQNNLGSCTMYLTCNCQNIQCENYAKAVGDICTVSGSGTKHDPFIFVFQKKQSMGALRMN